MFFKLLKLCSRWRDVSKISCSHEVIHVISTFVGDGEETEEGIDRTSASAVSNSEEQGEQSHLIVWQVQCPMPVTNA